MAQELDTTKYGVLTERTYRKTAAVQAVKADAKKFSMIRKWANNQIRRVHDRLWYITTREGELSICLADDYYICKGIDGEVWPVRADIFEKTYEVL